MNYLNTKKNRILITWRLLIDKIEEFNELFKSNRIVYDVIRLEQQAKKKDLIKIIHNYDGVICGDDEIDKQILDKAKKLKVISKWGTGLDSIDLNYCKKLGIKVYNSPGAFTNNVAQHALGLMFALSRNVVLNNKDIKKDKNWSKRTCIDLENSNFGIIGYGKIGKKIASYLKPISKNFLICDIKYKNYKSSLNKLILKSDVIFLCCDLNKTSKNLINLKRIKMMKKNSLLINISRGPIINNDDLIIALEKKMISGAGIDVFNKEPVPNNSKLIKFNNCIVTSHNAFNSREVIDRINKISVNNLINFFKNF